MRLVAYLLAVAGVVCPGMAWGYSFDNLTVVGTHSTVHVGPAFATSNIEYETQKGDRFETDRTLFGVGASADMGDDVSVSGQLGRVMNSEVRDYDLKGDGYVYGFGAKVLAHRGAKSNLICFTQFNFLTEDYEREVEGKKIDIELGMYELSIGGIMAITSNKRFTPFFGVELFPLQNGQLKAKGEDSDGLSLSKTATKDKAAKQTGSVDFKRHEILNLRAGADSSFGKFTVRGELAMISETTFMFGAGFLF